MNLKPINPHMISPKTNIFEGLQDICMSRSERQQIQREKTISALRKILVPSNSKMDRTTIYIYIYACQEKCTFEPFLSQENVAALKVSHHQSLQKPLEPPMSKHEARDRLLKGPCTTLGVDK